ncbi:uncharacterized protein MELLADRAFT_77949, partial [Melampsora larici-populina 98AG31]
MGHRRESSGFSAHDFISFDPPEIIGIYAKRFRDSLPPTERGTRIHDGRNDTFST